MLKEGDKIRIPSSLFQDSVHKPPQVEKLWKETLLAENNPPEEAVSLALVRIGDFFMEEAKQLLENYATKERNVQRSLITLQRLQ